MDTKVAQHIWTPRWHGIYMDTEVARHVWTLKGHGITYSIHLMQIRFTVDMQSSRFPFIARTDFRNLLLAAVGSTFSVL